MKIPCIISILFLCLTSVAQENRYLALELEGWQKNEISYPPGTEFFLFDANGDFILSDGDLVAPFEIKTPLTLIVAPKYKEDSDKFTISSGRILMKKTHVFNDSILTNSDQNGKYIVPVNVRKEYFDSDIEGQRNVLLVFNNGLVFRYFDDVARAWFDGEEVEVTGKHLILASEGIAKIS